VSEPTWVATLREALADPTQLSRTVAVRPGVGGRAAAVLILIAAGPAGPEVVFIERAGTMRTHAFQIAFPGGAADPTDVDLADTALREAQEEIGLDRAGVEILGQLPPAHVSVSGFDVTAVVAWWRDPVALRAVDVAEVASVPVVPIFRLVDANFRARVRHPAGYVGPAFEVDDHLIWGLSAHLLDAVLELGGWQQPWDHARELPIPPRYLTSHHDSGGPDAH
jgi:8-oxo-dGTP pyrophosphatase MutT (NUDIX family)